MKKGLIIIIYGLIISCSPKSYTQIAIYNDNLYGDIANGFPEKDTLITKYDSEQNILSKGKFAITKTDEISDIKVGNWTEYYNGGMIKEEGTYKIGSFIDCCTGGHCRAFYYYRDGLWKFYDEQGTLTFQLEFVPSRLHVDTRCGGDSLTYGLIKSFPISYYDTLSPDKIFELQKIYVAEDDGTIIYTPVNDELYIRFDRKR